MAEDLKKPIEESSLERLKRVAEELKKTGVKESRKENLIENDPSINSGSSRVQSRDEETPNPGIGTIERPVPQKGEMKITETSLSDLIQEKMRLEKILQELNNLKSKICQRIGLIKTIERRENELNQQLASVRKENDFSDQIKKRFENLKENIK